MRSKQLRFAPRASFAIAVALVLAVPTLEASRAEGSSQEERSEWRVPRRKARKKNPLTVDEKTLALGKQVFLRECMSCHGETGRGDGVAAKDLDVTPGNLSDPAMWEQSDGALFWKVSTGRSPMPTFDLLLKDEDRWRVVSYIRTLAPSPGAAGPPFAPLVRSYLGLQTALAKDELEAARKAAVELSAASGTLAKVDTSGWTEEERGRWKTDLESMQRATRGMASAADLNGLRIALRDLSGKLVPTVEKQGHGQTTSLYVFSCSRAFEGEDVVWLQASAEPSNPFLGTGGRSCGVKLKELPRSEAKKPDKSGRG